MTFVVPTEKLTLSKSERFFGIAFPLIAACLIFLDIIEDSQEGVHIPHLILEFTLFCFSILAAGYLYLRTSTRMSVENRNLAQELSKVCNDFNQWQERTKNIYRSLANEINQQFTDWGLSAAEIEIATLLLKGMTHKEIASLRNSSEQTVRQQSASIYAKSKLEGRAQFSAFFLEGLVSIVEDNQGE